MVRPATLPPSTSNNVAPAKAVDRKAKAAVAAPRVAKRAHEAVLVEKPRRKASKKLSEGKRLIRQYRAARETQAAVETSHLNPLTRAFVWRIIRNYRAENQVEFKVKKAAFALLYDLAHTLSNGSMGKIDFVMQQNGKHIVTAEHVEAAREIEHLKLAVVPYEQRPEQVTLRASDRCLAHKKQKAEASVERKARKEAAAAAAAQ